MAFLTQRNCLFPGDVNGNESSLTGAQYRLGGMLQVEEEVRRPDP
jgi:hypothetical protein